MKIFQREKEEKIVKKVNGKKMSMFFKEFGKTKFQQEAQKRE